MRGASAALAAFLIEMMEIVPVSQKTLIELSAG
jgi:hypothetical protein